MKLQPGIRHEARMMVQPHMIVPALAPSLAPFVNMPPVLSSAWMIAFIESTCAEAVASCLPAGSHSVGTGFRLTHVAPTPAGMEVIARVRLSEVKGSRLFFLVQCADEREIIGEGTHDRAVVEHERFMKRVDAKNAYQKSPGAKSPFQEDPE